MHTATIDVAGDDIYVRFHHDSLSLTTGYGTYLINELDVASTASLLC